MAAQYTGVGFGLEITDCEWLGFASLQVDLLDLVASWIVALRLSMADDDRLTIGGKRRLFEGGDLGDAIERFNRIAILGLDVSTSRRIRLVGYRRSDGIPLA